MDKQAEYKVSHLFSDNRFYLCEDCMNEMTNCNTSSDYEVVNIRWRELKDLHCDGSHEESNTEKKTGLTPWKLPNNYFGPHWDNYYVIAGRHRDSDLLTNHNYDTIWEALSEEDTLPKWINEGEENEEEILVNVTENHFLVGYVEWIALHKQADPKLIGLAVKLLTDLSNYLVLDEYGYSEKEWEAAQGCWVGLTLGDRVELCQQYNVSIFAARHDWIPNDDNGSIFEYCRGE